MITAVPFVILWILMWGALGSDYWVGMLLAVPAAGFLVRLFSEHYVVLAEYPLVADVRAIAFLGARILLRRAVKGAHRVLLC